MISNIISNIIAGMFKIVWQKFALDQASYLCFAICIELSCADFTYYAQQQVMFQKTTIIRILNTLKLLGN